MVFLVKAVNVGRRYGFANHTRRRRGYARIRRAFWLGSLHKNKGVLCPKVVR